MLSLSPLELVVAVLVLLVVLAVAGVGVVLFLKYAAKRAPETKHSVTMTEKIRAVGKLVGLEVHAKEIATSTKGWAWVPPLLLSQAKLAMIFHFEKQYAVDLAAIDAGDIQQVGETGYRLTLPGVEGSLRLTSVEPYDIQAGKVAGLIDVMPMNADRQRQLIEDAQGQAASLFEKSDEKYIREAERSIERHLTSLMKLMGIDLEVSWVKRDEQVNVGGRLDLAVEGVE